MSSITVILAIFSVILLQDVCVTKGEDTQKTIEAIEQFRRSLDFHLDETNNVIYNITAIYKDWKTYSTNLKDYVDQLKGGDVAEGTPEKLIKELDINSDVGAEVARLQQHMLDGCKELIADAAVFKTFLEKLKQG